MKLSGKAHWYLWSIVVFVITAAYAMWSHKAKHRDIDLHKGVTIGTVVEHGPSGRSGTFTKYAYEVGGVTYESYSSDDKRFGGSPIGLRFTVEYSTVDPRNSRILWGQSAGKTTYIPEPPH